MPTGSAATATTAVGARTAVRVTAGAARLAYASDDRRSVVDLRDRLCIGTPGAPRAAVAAHCAKRAKNISMSAQSTGRPSGTAATTTSTSAGGAGGRIRASVSRHAIRPARAAYADADRRTVMGVAAPTAISERRPDRQATELGDQD
ncbi:hypothetical protein [Bradyrhizobium sp. ORS 111]|uniref:hypothetical protein n=1 Tax=Bradyrhizobium sp. ORS 111 TaxID=1685958 RepID=UPI003890DCE0